MTEWKFDQLMYKVYLFMLREKFAEKQKHRIFSFKKY